MMSPFGGVTRDIYPFLTGMNPIRIAISCSWKRTPTLQAWENVCPQAWLGKVTGSMVGFDGDSMGIPTETAEIFSLWNCSSEVTKGLLAPKKTWFWGVRLRGCCDLSDLGKILHFCWIRRFDKLSSHPLGKWYSSKGQDHMWRKVEDHWGDLMFMNVYGHRKIENELLKHQIYVNHFQVQTPQPAAGLSPDLPCVSSQPSAQKLLNSAGIPKPLWPTSWRQRQNQLYIRSLEWGTSERYSYKIIQDMILEGWDWQHMEVS